MEHDPVRVANTKAWLVKAGQDLRATDVVLSASPALVWDAMFHCQQAVEKALKGLLTWNDRPFPKTHDLVDLGQRCSEIDWTLAPLLQKAAFLTPYASTLRYPGDLPDPAPAEAGNALALARDVVEAIRSRLPSEARP
jgi:HEPN domain-containing protein